MSWAIGFDAKWDRWIGYGVPAYCDHPDCWAEIDRGLTYVCGDEPYGGEHGCGLYFCSHHGSGLHQRCPRCRHYRKPYPKKHEHEDWVRHVRKDPSWAEWRADNPDSPLLTGDHYGRPHQTKVGAA